MSNITRTFRAGRMNKALDERLVPQDEYIDALNVRVNSSNDSNAGTVENAASNELLASLSYKFQSLNIAATTIGAYADSSRETLYWFVHQPNWDASGNLDMIVSYNLSNNQLTYHVVTRETLNFNPQYLICSVNMIEDILYFTDNYNPPRRINVKRTYLQPNDAEVDQTFDTDLNVIVKPPFAAPQIQLTNTPGEEDFLETRFISFAYRYKYRDNEYSALSQFSPVAFQPKPFSIDTALYLNGGMVNEYNTALVSFDTGPSDVIGVDLCFKYADDSTIRVIDKYIKYEEGWENNVTKTIAFTNKKIYTILPDSEILRLYDNVPRLAQAQTLMGNRLMYANYLEGYDLTTASGSPIRTNYTTELLSDVPGYEFGDGEVEFVNNFFDINDEGGVLHSGAIKFDLSGIELTNGSVFGFTVSLTHQHWSGTDDPGLTANDGLDPFELSFIFYLDSNYSNAHQMVSSTAFAQRLGTNAYVSDVGDCAEGVTFADDFNCAIVAPAGYALHDSGFQQLPTPVRGIKVVPHPGDTNKFSIVFPALQYEDTTTGANQIYEYLKISFGNWSFQTQGDTRSLHSNRDYEVGIVYMDDYKRATTALVSNGNTLYVPTSASDTINRIRVHIPSDMTPPSWATNYKFVLKPTQEDYEVVYTSFYYPDPNESVVWMRLDGDNQRKVEAGDELTVKADVTGPLNSKRVVSVLEKRLFERDEIVDGSLPGVYIRIKPSGITIDSDSTLELGCNEANNTSHTHNNGTARLVYPVFESLAGGTYQPWAIPAGSNVSITIKADRENRAGCGGNCGAMYYLFEVDRVASQNYASLKDFWDGEDIDLEEAFTDIDCADADNPVDTYYNPAIVSFNSSAGGAPDDYLMSSHGTLTVQFADDSATSKQYMLVSNGMVPCSGFPQKDSHLKVEVCVRQAMKPVIFETKPADAQPDIFYESSDVYRCDETGHFGNVQNQVLGVSPGIVDLDFFDCYCFGNGVESYKVKDSMTGHYFRLGQRVTSTSAQDYREIRRFADVTYSGIYNAESNVNKLNEFNLGLSNYKALESSYGHIQRIDGRESDILVLQEDKISYLLVGKDLLSDAGAGSALVAVPEVLGTQIVRIEEYGISYQPESFAKYGQDKFFTDVKRGVVLQLSGSAYNNEQLAVISDLGMRPYFRSQFIGGLYKQKLGAYDPYHDEYVLNINNINKPIEQECYNCGRSFSLLVTSDRKDYCFNTGGAVGKIDISVSCSDNVDITVTATHGDNSSTTVINGFGTVTIDADDPQITEYTITLSATEDAYVSVLAQCPKSEALSVRLITITSDSLAGQTITNEMYWSQGAYSSSSFSDSVQFLEGGAPFVVSQYQTLNGYEGVGVMPADGSTVRLTSVKTPSDSFVFDPSYHHMYALRTFDNYTNSIQDIEALIDAAELLNPVNIDNAPAQYYSEYAVPSVGNILYFVFDYRDIHAAEVCYSVRDADGACCECTHACSETVMFLASLPQSYGAEVCDLDTNAVMYHDGGGVYPDVGDRVYTYNETTEAFDSVDYSLTRLAGVNMRLKTSSSGLVISRQPCASFQYVFSSGSNDAADACSDQDTITVYSATDLLFNERLVFTSENMQTPLPPGFYRNDATSQVLEVGPDGMIINTEIC